MSRGSFSRLALVSTIALVTASSVTGVLAQAPNTSFAITVPAEPNPVARTPQVVVDGRAALVSHYDPKSMLRLAIVLAPSHPAEEDQFLQDVLNRQSPLFHKFLTAEEWNTRFGPTEEDEQAVVDWARSRGLTITNRFPNRLLVDVEAPASVIEDALHVTINQYRLPAGEDEEQGRIAYSNDRDPELPSRIAEIVLSVQGLNSVESMAPASYRGPLPATPDYVPGPPIEESNSVKADAPSFSASSDVGVDSRVTPEITPPNPNFWTPAFVYSSPVYNYQALMNLCHCCNPRNAPSQSPRETSIAIAAFGHAVPSDVFNFAQQFNLSINLFHASVDGQYTCANTKAGVDPNCIEATLDTEWAMTTANSSTAASTAAVFLYEGANYNNATFIDLYNYILSGNHARIMSTSWGCPENPSSGTNGCTADTMRARDNVFKSMVGQGWTILAATGDQGAVAGCGNTLHVQFPASSPYVVAVGGTSLNEGKVSANYEVAWTGSAAQGSCGKNNGGSTGGFSEYWPVPPYQAYLRYARRAVPDIALDAFHPHDVYINGAWGYYGGTSVATPMLAGFFAQENAYLLSIGNRCGDKGTSPCAPLGDPHNAIYEEGRFNDSEHNPFYDILSGCNSNDLTVQYQLTPFCAGTGFDEVTGWGSANMLQLAWSINLHTVTYAFRPYVTFTGPKVNKWSNTNQTVKWTINDYHGAANSGTGIAGFAQSWDTPLKDSATKPHGGAKDLFYSGPQFPNASTGCLSLTGADGCGRGISQGCHTVYVHGWNNIGESTGGQPDFPESYGPVCYDTVPPVVAIAASPKPNAQAWNNTPVTETITASDPGNVAIGKVRVVTASGIKHIYYGVDDRCSETNLPGCAIYKGPLKFTKDGIYTVYFFAEDNAGNFGSTKFAYQRVQLDQTPPATTIQVSGTLSNGSYVTPVGIVLGATDATSGVLWTYYQLDGGAATAYDIGSSQPIPVTALGSHTFKYWSTDYAGNVETAHTLTFTIADGTVTTLTATPTPALYGQAIVFKATVTDPITGATPTGTITFRNGTTSIGMITLVNGVASESDGNLPIGTSAMSAIFTGTGRFSNSTSAVVNVVVQQTQAVSVSLLSSENPALSGDSITFKASVIADVSGVTTGTVTFMDGTTVLGTSPLNYPYAAYTTSALSVGTHSITAVYSGDTNYGKGTSQPLAQVVNAATQ